MLSAVLAFGTAGTSLAAAPGGEYQTAVLEEGQSSQEVTDGTGEETQLPGEGAGENDGTVTEPGQTPAEGEDQEPSGSDETANPGNPSERKEQNNREIPRIRVSPEKPETKGIQAKAEIRKIPEK